MTPDEYSDHLRAIRQRVGQDIGLAWRKHRLAPVYDLSKDLIGWKLVWVGVFDVDSFFLRLKESWTGGGTAFERAHFSYHYGPFEPHWDLETVMAKKVSARIDGEDYHGRGFHIHDGLKERRIYQCDLRSPDLAQFSPVDFVSCVSQMRLGQNVIDAFKLKLV
jgi:hypothetical protein